MLGLFGASSTGWFGTVLVPFFNVDVNIANAIYALIVGVALLILYRYFTLVEKDPRPVTVSTTAEDRRDNDHRESGAG